MVEKLHFLRPAGTDWQEFLQVATGEGWQVPQGEISLFRGPCADSAMALRYRDRFAGLVTLLQHGRSAWIGNLIVMPALRGRGYGRLLLEEAIRRLEQQQVRSIWLTASEDGFPLYRRRGFLVLGQVERWIRADGGTGAAALAEGDGRDLLRAADLLTWGERRELLERLLPESTSLHCGGEVALLQRQPGLQILGPWYAGTGSWQERHGTLLAAALAAASPEQELVLDVRAGALPEGLLTQAGFVRQGRTRLMARGDLGGVDLQTLVSFASLGSMG